MNKSLCLEREKIYWENEYKLLSKKYEDVSVSIFDNLLTKLFF